jgi:hypothetical protein
MSSPDYYRRQAMSSLALAHSASNPETKCQFMELASEYLTRAESTAHAQLDEFIAKRHVGVFVLRR